MPGSISPSLPHPPPPARADVADTQIASNLAGLQRSYQQAVNSGQPAAALSTLAKQITDAAQTLGMSADLPRSTAAAPAPVITSTKIDVHA